MGFMKKTSLIVIVTFLFLIISTTGCFEDGKTTEQSKFVGVWLPEEELYKSKRFEFLENGTCFFRTYKYKGTYEVNKTKKILTVNVEKLSKTYTYTYQFNFDYTDLTLENHDNFEIIKYLKQET